jgi:hypothetical protein
MGITFKKQPKETGLHSIGYPYPNVDIKLDKKTMGYISAPTWQTKNVWNIYLSVKKSEPDDNSNCDWKWVTVKKDFENEIEAREFIKGHIEEIQKKFVFHFTE